MMKASMDVYLAACTCPAGTAAMFGLKNTMFILKILILPVYILINVLGLSSVYQNVTLKKSGILKKLAKIGGYVHSKNLSSHY